MFNIVTEKGRDTAQRHTWRCQSDLLVLLQIWNLMGAFMLKGINKIKKSISSKKHSVWGRANVFPHLSGYFFFFLVLQTLQENAGDLHQVIDEKWPRTSIFLEAKTKTNSKVLPTERLFGVSCKIHLCASQHDSGIVLLMQIKMIAR